jgi:hypothetical protein
VTWKRHAVNRGNQRRKENKQYLTKASRNEKIEWERRKMGGK